jgi:hypothetical protein
MPENLFPPLDPEDLAEARRTIDEMKSGRMNGIPMEQLLDELDRMAETGWSPGSDSPAAPH